MLNMDSELSIGENIINAHMKNMDISAYPSPSQLVHF